MIMLLSYALRFVYKQSYNKAITNFICEKDEKVLNDLEKQQI